MTQVKARIRSVTVEQDEITREISSLFDFPFDGATLFEAPTLKGIPSDYGIGLIVGPSGSGKSTLLSELGSADRLEWDARRAIASHFASASDCVDRLSAVGLNSIPSWLRPFHVLSTGEQFRADLARRLKDGAVVDEFTSTVDRNVAKACSYALRRYVDRKNLRRVVFATCHYDVLEWLQPDWVFDTAAGTLTVGRSQSRPTIQVDLLPCSAEIWPRFRPHHYLSGRLNPSARCWVAVWNGQAIGFASALAFPNGNFKNAWREHRTVVLPEYQGLGIGVRISDALGEMFLKESFRYFSKTAHPRLGSYRENSPRWRATSKNKKARPDYASDRPYKTKEHKTKKVHSLRVCFSHEYVGAGQSCL